MEAHLSIQCVMQVEDRINYGVHHERGGASFTLPDSVVGIMKKFRTKLLDARYLPETDSHFQSLASLAAIHHHCTESSQCCFMTRRLKVVGDSVEINLDGDRGMLIENVCFFIYIMNLSI